ncbi:MAG: hypothetical protein ACK5LJ_17250 [Paracoccus sp. (in: a-proteobacteria)]
MHLNPISGSNPGLPSARLNEIHDCLTLALDASERPTGYSQPEREARSYVRAALRQTAKLMEGVACR